MSIDRSQQRGITLIEQIMFIVIVSVGVVALVSAMYPMIRASADPMRTKQLVAVAETVLGEILHQPFTWCDPDDATASTALSYADCANPQNTGTHGAGENRDGSGGMTPFDNVDDYGGFSMSNVTDAAGANAVAGYDVAVAIVRAGTSFGLADNEAALAITVTVTAGSESFALTGYRFRYAPRY